jgi:L-rhamnose mutarotase
MTRHCLALDLKDDPALIAEYEDYHTAVWPEIKQSILASGIKQMVIYRTGNRLFMIMDVEDDFSFTQKARLDADNPKVQEWEELLWKYQQALPTAAPGQKWVLMDKIFELNNNEEEVKNQK